MADSEYPPMNIYRRLDSWSVCISGLQGGSQFPYTPLMYKELLRKQKCVDLKSPSMHAAAVLRGAETQSDEGAHTPVQPEVQHLPIQFTVTPPTPLPPKLRLPMPSLPGPSRPNLSLQGPPQPSLSLPGPSQINSCPPRPCPPRRSLSR